MNHFILPALAGFLLLGILLSWLLQGGTASENENDRLKMSETLSYVQLHLLSPILLKRMFDPKDLEFVRGEGSHELIRLLNNERKAAVIGWLQRMRLDVSRLMGYRIKYARGMTKLRPAMELRLAFEYVAFLMTYYLLISLISLWGPFHTRKLVWRATESAALFCGIFHEFVSSSGNYKKQLSGM